MSILRRITALFLFVLGVYLMIDLFLSGFEWYLLAIALACLLAAHYVSPGKDDSDSDWSLLDSIDLLIHIPFRVIALGLRAFGRHLLD